MTDSSHADQSTAQRAGPAQAAARESGSSTLRAELAQLEGLLALRRQVHGAGDARLGELQQMMAVRRQLLAAAPGADAETVAESVARAAAAAEAIPA